MAIFGLELFQQLASDRSFDFAKELRHLNIVMSNVFKRHQAAAELGIPRKPDDGKGKASMNKNDSDRALTLHNSRLSDIQLLFNLISAHRAARCLKLQLPLLSKDALMRTIDVTRSVTDELQSAEATLPGDKPQKISDSEVIAALVKRIDRLREAEPPITATAPASRPSEAQLCDWVEENASRIMELSEDQHWALWTSIPGLELYLQLSFTQTFEFDDELDYVASVMDQLFERHLVDEGAAKQDGPGD